ncbi:TetR/AcrR family transcriptional regulator [Novosphingobium tardum]|uniref:TetR/AcrR family transcriptional regulator n=1 Tax=Novosphingobium tardum TaxID=1538021 RepID=A0ABV8RRY6_9SPHN
MTNPAPATSEEVSKPAHARRRGGSAPGRRYDSAGMQNRRARILAEAQALLSEVGIEEFTIGELSKRAGVAQRTLYRNLGSREDIMARAIAAQHDGLLSTIPPFKARSLAQCLDRAATVARFVIALRGYATAMVTVFFSATIDRRIFEELRGIPLRGYGNFFEDGVEAGIIRPMTEGEKLLAAQRMPHQSYGLVSDWAAGRLTDEQFVERAPISFLLSMHPFLTDEARAEADAILSAHAEHVAAEQSALDDD